MDDLISRRAAIDVFDVGAELLRRVLDDADIVGTERAKYEWGLGLIESYISDMKELPSAQPERKKGRWIFCDTSCKCSICGEDPMTFVETTGFNSALMDREYPMRFCPNCGTKMEANGNE